MARPSGYELNRSAWDDMLRLTGVSLTKVAELAAVPRPTLSALVGGHHKASIPMAHKVAKALGCNPGTLFPTIDRPAS